MNPDLVKDIAIDVVLVAIIIELYYIYKAIKTKKYDKTRKSIPNNRGRRGHNKTSRTDNSTRNNKNSRQQSNGNRICNDIPYIYSSTKTTTRSYGGDKK
jgi:hypothetical protein